MYGLIKLFSIFVIWHFKLSCVQNNGNRPFWCQQHTSSLSDEINVMVSQKMQKKLGWVGVGRSQHVGHSDSTKDSKSSGTPYHDFESSCSVCGKLGALGMQACAAVGKLPWVLRYARVCCEHRKIKFIKKMSLVWQSFNGSIVSQQHNVILVLVLWNVNCCSKIKHLISTVEPRCKVVDANHKLLTMLYLGCIIIVAGGGGGGGGGG